MEDTEAKAQSIEDPPALRELLKNDAEFTQLCTMALPDSGATHPLRPRTGKDAVENIGKVSVTLAGENRVEMQQSRAGTIVGAEGSQAIVPLGTLVKQLGYEFGWDRRGCRLRHPSKSEVRVYTRSACPEIMSNSPAKRCVATTTLLSQACSCEQLTSEEVWSHEYVACAGL